MALHRYSIGQQVRMTGWRRQSTGPAETFRVVATLPERNDLLQYRIRSDNERHERVTTEDNLENADAASFWKSA
ncbi:hypothetical protein [uncultured Roseibium sp.]|uniref:hypothetical protein n=1 Tax=uncultured Roseibium sp. TaxID=1936171 RepID=UPI003217AF81